MTIETHTDQATLHIVGAGMAGLSAAVEAVKGGARVKLYESAGHGGGRCRSFHDMTLDRMIDNGNHLILGANTAIFDYLTTIGAGDALAPLDPPRFSFIDVTDNERWRLEPKDGLLPLWLFSNEGRIPGSRLGDLMDGGRLAFASADKTIAQCVNREAPLFERFWQPLARAVLNTDATEGSAQLLWRMLKETLGKGAAGSRPYLAQNGLSAALVDPAIRYLKSQNVEIVFNRRLKSLDIEHDTLTGLILDETIVLNPNDRLILAVPPAEASSLVPGLSVPTETRPIVNVHFRVDRNTSLPDDSAFLGLIGTDTHWVFKRDDILSVTISAATALAGSPSDEIAAKIWAELAPLVSAPIAKMPSHRVIKEQRATIAQTPSQVLLRPPAKTRIGRVYLAGDWTDTGLPATIEGAVRSGVTASRMALTEA